MKSRDETRQYADPCAAAPCRKRLAVVIGASGYIGTNLVPPLCEAGWQVRATSRNIEVLAAFGWAGVQIAEADILNEPSLEHALVDADVVFYLVHCMAAGGDFASLERRGARNLVRAALKTGIRRIVYLGGLMPENPRSQHLRARGETGEILRGADCEVVELRAGMVIGPGSAAWEVIRDLVNHLPVMVAPRWVRSRSTPVALENLLTYLVGAIDMPTGENPVFEVAGPEICTYESMMRRYGALVGKKPIIIEVPLLTPKLSSYWLWLVTSVPTNVAAALIEGLEHDYIATDSRIRQLIPQRLLDFEEAAQAAVHADRSHSVLSRWVEGSTTPRDKNPALGFYAKLMSREADSPASIDALWQEVVRFGAQGDFVFASWLWRVRLFIDWLTGGSSARVGRRHPTELRIGDVFSGWRVVVLEPRRLLSLRMQMRGPGAGVLEFRTRPASAGSRIRVTARWYPAGFWGLLYWYAFWPVHAFLFRGLVRTLAHRADFA